MSTHAPTTTARLNAVRKVHALIAHTEARIRSYEARLATCQVQATIAKREAAERPSRQNIEALYDAERSLSIARGQLANARQELEDYGRNYPALVNEYLYG